MAATNQSAPDVELPDGIEWERAQEEEQIRSAIEYMLSMSPAERLERHSAAARAIKRLEAIAARHGLRAIGWTITGPALREEG
jgi:hypothetical protein